MHVCIHTHIFNSRKLQKARHLKFPFSPPKYLPNPGIKPASLASPASTGRLFTTAPHGKLLLQIVILPDDIILYRGSFLGRGKQCHVRLFLVCWRWASTSHWSFPLGSEIHPWIFSLRLAFVCSFLSGMHLISLSRFPRAFFWSCWIRGKPCGVYTCCSEGLLRYALETGWGGGLGWRHHGPGHSPWEHLLAHRAHRANGLSSGKWPSPASFCRNAWLPSRLSGTPTIFSKNVSFPLFFDDTPQPLLIAVFLRAFLTFQSTCI